MKRILLSTLLITLQSCSIYAIDDNNAKAQEPVCAGSLDLPAELVSQFDTVEDEALLNETLGEPTKGKLCQGKVYKSKKNTQIMIFRAWNSTNPDSKYGQWWAFDKPYGKISQYREEYEICYQWSPLDKLLSCTLQPEAKVVVGNGQSAQCSQYLTYPVSDKQQVYIIDPENTVINCSEYDALMSWK